MVSSIVGHFFCIVFIAGRILIARLIPAYAASLATALTANPTAATVATK
jgi:hypothetical protein